MRRADFNELLIKKQHRPKLTPFTFDEIIAYDTETIKGTARLIADSKGNYIHPESFSDCIEFLTRRKYRNVLGWFYNINHDIESILKWLHIDRVKEFAPFSEIEDYFVETDFIKLKLIKGKMFKIQRGKHTFVFYDIGNFYKGGLNINAQKYLGEQKDDLGEIDWSKITMRQLKSKKYINYCIQDANLTERLSVNFIETCNRFGIWTKNFCSPASLATHYFMSKCEIPTLSELTKGRTMRSKLAYEAYKGGFIQTFKRGYFEKVYLYDINSAYPHQIARLPDLKKGRFVFRMRETHPEAYHGWLRVIIRDKAPAPYSPAYYSPVATYIKKFNKNYYFAGTISATITLLEYENLKNDFDIEVIDGVYWIPETLEFLYKNEVESLYKLRQENKNDKNLNLLLKTILNGYYGKLIQKIPKKDSTQFEFETGNLFNPFHASYITAGCRVQIYNAIRKHGAQDLIACMTDAVAYTKPIELTESKNLGDWSLELSGEAVFIGSGLYTIKTESGKVKTATRGFRLTDKLNFFKLLSMNLKKDIIKMPQNVRLTYKEALRVKRFLDWNIIQNSEKRININCDTKRQWERDFKNSRDVLENVIDSAPIFVNMVS